MRPVIASAAKQSIEPHAALFTSPMGRGRRAAPGEGIPFIDTQKPLTRITSDDAIRPLPAGEVTNRPFHPDESAKGRYQLAMTVAAQ